MELKILNPQEGGFLKEIQWNNEELKAEIAEKMQEYASLAFTEDTIKEAKADRAKLNKLRTAFEDERKRIKKLCMAPYDAFEKQVKELIALIDEPIRLIDGQIKEVEERRKVEKKGEILEFYESVIGSLKGILPFDRVFRQEYLNVSKSMKSIKEEIQALIDRVNSDLDTIERLGSKHELQIKDAYLKTLNLSVAMQEKARLEEVERQLAERKQREEEETKRRCQPVFVPIPGEGNCRNALAAAACCLSLGVPPAAIADGIAKTVVKGRAELVCSGSGIRVWIDYAHNGESLREILRTLRRYHPARLICLFGCGGERSRNRRYPMGTASGELADLTVLTEDNSRREDPRLIMEEIRRGIEAVNGRYVVIMDRAEAIAWTIGQARPGDWIVLAGKGHESSQEKNGVRTPFSEHRIVRELWEKRARL